MTNDLISRQAVIEEVEFGITYAKAINIETGEVREPFKVSNEELQKAVERIKALPAVEKKGKWIKGIGENGINTSLYCDQCGYENGHWYEWNYCPNCGARMEENE